MKVQVSTSTTVLSSEPVTEEQVSRLGEIFRERVAQSPYDIELHVSFEDDRSTSYKVINAISAQDEDDAQADAEECFEQSCLKWIDTL